MGYKFGLDLRVARKRSSLTQEDCSHILGVDETRISKLEAGTLTPTVEELSILCLAYGRSIGALAQDVVISHLEDLQKRLSTMPECPTNWPGRENRQRTLNVLADRLAALDTELYG